MNTNKIRRDFPILKRRVNGKPLIYLDNAATSQKPEAVIDALTTYYKKYNANVHRGIHKLSEEATQAYEETRKKISKFINAKSEKEIIFTKNTTEAINLVMYSFGMQLKPGDEVISSVMEHHSNIVPWQFLQNFGIKLKFVDINEDGTLKIEDYEKLITPHTKLIAVTHVSNVLGTINPIKEISRIAHKNNILLLVDAAQSVPHMEVDVQEIDCDFMAFSSHKMLGPTGVGVLYAKRELLERMKPFLYGGDMIREVSLYETKYNEVPWKFEAGTPNIADVIAFGAAIEYLEKIGMKNIEKHERELTKYALKKLSKIKNLEIYGPKNPNQRIGVISFNLKNIHPHDVASILDQEGIAIRSGHLCAQPLMKRLNIQAAARASFYLYNTKKDIDKLVQALLKVKKVFKQ
jgi:cysteine desulfurase/selenocysteine lyase